MQESRIAVHVYPKELAQHRSDANENLLLFGQSAFQFEQLGINALLQVSIQRQTLKVVTPSPKPLTKLSQYFEGDSTLREEIFAGINFREFFFRTFRGN